MSGHFIYHEGDLAMDHDEVVRQKLTERYLLNELEGQTRDEFEEHYFECSECALDVRAASQFVVHTKVVLAESPEAAREKVAVLKPAKPGWFAWLRPAFAAPVFALLIAVVGYQNLVTLPVMRSRLSQPKVMPWAAVAVGTWGSSGPTIPVAQGKGFLLFVRIPPDGTYARYTADLYNPAGRLESSLDIPAAGTNDQWPVLVPEANRESGNYRIAVRGVTSSGAIKELGSAPFTLQIQK
jgi:hypothetical protein